MGSEPSLASLTLSCELDADDLRDVMAASRLLTVLRRSWIVASVVLLALLVELLLLLRMVASRPPDTTLRGPVRAELAVGAVICMLLALWSSIRAWRLSPRRQASHALARGIWQRGPHKYELAAEGVTWQAPDGSIVFLPWSVLTGVRETSRLYLLLDQRGRHVRGFIPKHGIDDLVREAEIGRFLRSRIRSGNFLS
jgi:hypothetical protein